MVAINHTHSERVRCTPQCQAYTVRAALKASADDGHEELNQHYNGGEKELLEHMQEWLDEHRALIETLPEREYDPQAAMTAVLRAYGRVRDGQWVRGAVTHVFAELLGELRTAGWELTAVERDADGAAAEDAWGMLDRMADSGTAALDTNGLISHYREAELPFSDTDLALAIEAAIAALYKEREVGGSMHSAAAAAAVAVLEELRRHHA